MQVIPVRVGDDIGVGAVVEPGQGRADVLLVGDRVAVVVEHGAHGGGVAHPVGPACAGVEGGRGPCCPGRRCRPRVRGGEPE